MARIRTIKPSFWGDARVAGLSRDERLLMIGLISLADDEGRFLASTTAIGGHVFPHDELAPAAIRRWRDAIAKAGLIELYKVDGREYGWFPNWSKHQKINRAAKSPLPEPPSFTDHSPPPGPPPRRPRSEPRTDDSRSDSVNPHGATGEPFTGGREGKGSSTYERAPVASVDAGEATTGTDRTPAQHLAARYGAGVKLTDHGRALRVLGEAIAAGYAPALLEAAVDVLIAEQRACTLDTLRIALLSAPGNWGPPAGRPSRPGNPYLDDLRAAAAASGADAARVLWPVPDPPALEA
jgi:hypothetical protein